MPQFSPELWIFHQCKQGDWFYLKNGEVKLNKDCNKAKGVIYYIFKLLVWYLNRLANFQTSKS
jgi:hypothetical protein